MKYTLESAQLIKSSLESQTQIIHLPSLVVLNDLSELLKPNTKVYYFGLLTIGNQPLQPDNSIDLLNDGNIICNLDQNNKDCSLFQSLNVVDIDYNLTNETNFSGQFIGYIFTPTKNKAKNIDIRFDL